MSTGRVVSTRGLSPMLAASRPAHAPRAASLKLVADQKASLNGGAQLKPVGPKIIKRYQNRKLYDTRYSCYVTLHEVAKMICAGEDIVIVDNQTKCDITALTLVQIIFDAERRKAAYAPVRTLRQIIQNGKGTMSDYLEKVGAFAPPSGLKPRVVLQGFKSPHVRPAQVPQNLTLEERIVAAATPLAAHQQDVDGHTPSLPRSQRAVGK